MTSNIPRRKLLILIPSLRGGGAERVVVSLLCHFDRSRFQLALAVVDMRGAVFRNEIPEDVELIDLACRRVREAMPRVIGLVWRQRPDVVFSTLGHLNLALAILRPLFPSGVRFIARETSIVSHLLLEYSFPRAWAIAYRKFYHRFDSVICQCGYMQRDLVTNFDVPFAITVVIHNPVDVNRIRSLSASPELAEEGAEWVESDAMRLNLVAAGRLSSEKGFDLLIEALALCRNPSIYLTVLGEGPQRVKLELLAESLGVKEQIRFAGFQKNPYVFFARADAFVLSSRYEGFPNVVLEALACGTPVIATPAPGGVREIIGGVDGCILADAVSPEALACAIASFTKGPRIPPAVVDPYAVQEIVRQYQEVLI